MLSAVYVLWGLLMVAGCGALMYLANRIEPHWVSKDGKRFLCNAQPLSTHGDPAGRWREVRVTVLTDAAVQLDQRRRLTSRRLAADIWKVEALAPEPPRGRAVFLLRSRSAAAGKELMAVRLPAKSQAVTTLQRCLADAAL